LNKAAEAVMDGLKAKYAAKITARLAAVWGDL
jgi:hypothetical protein